MITHRVSLDYWLLHAASTQCAALIGGAILLTLPFRRVLAFVLLSVWLPALAAAVMVPFLLPHGAGVSVLQGLLIAPAFALPSLRVLIRAPDDMVRVARTLGANGRLRVLLVWLPLLRARLLWGLAMTIPVSGILAFLLLSA